MLNSPWRGTRCTCWSLGWRGMKRGGAAKGRRPFVEGRSASRFCKQKKESRETPQRGFIPSGIRVLSLHLFSSGLRSLHTTRKRIGFARLLTFCGTPKLFPGLRTVGMETAVDFRARKPDPCPKNASASASTSASTGASNGARVHLGRDSIAQQVYVQRRLLKYKLLLQKWSTETSHVLPLHSHPKVRKRAFDVLPREADAPMRF